MDLGYAGRVALIVGGSGLIGSAVVARLEAEGATVAAASRSTGFDASSDASVTAGVSRVIEQHGRLDAVVVAAAPSSFALDPAKSSEPDEVLAAFDAKAMGFLRVANAAIPIMTAAGFGRVVGVSGQNALITGSITGSVRNAGLIVAAKNLADAAAGTGVTVNTVSPGVVTTEPPAAPQRGVPGQSSPAQIADLIAFLASPLAGAISGESIAIGHRVPGVVSM